MHMGVGEGTQQTGRPSHCTTSNHGPESAMTTSSQPSSASDYPKNAVGRSLDGTHTAAMYRHSLILGGSAGDMVVHAPAAHVSVVAHHVGDAAPLEV